MTAGPAEKQSNGVRLSGTGTNRNVGSDLLAGAEPEIDISELEP
jgi:hypothetical protein